MRDVKNKICRDLDLGGLIEDDNGMELLVAGQIVKLDLTVAAVYEQVWSSSPAAQGFAEGASAMVVVYRLQGLDGDATEPFVESVDQSEAEEKDPETEYAPTTRLFVAAPAPKHSPFMAAPAPKHSPFVAGTPSRTSWARRAASPS